MVQLTGNTAHDEIPKVTIHELKRLLESNPDLVVLDAQQKDIYQQGHIQGAISFPWKPKITAIDARFLPRDKALVVYCDCGPEDTDSLEVAAQLVSLGFSDVKVLTHPSIQGWIEAGYPVGK